VTRGSSGVENGWVFGRRGVEDVRRERCEVEGAAGDRGGGSGWLGAGCFVFSVFGFGLGSFGKFRWRYWRAGNELRAGRRWRRVVGFVSHSAFLDVGEAVVRAEILAVEAGFVAVDEVEGACFRGKRAERHGGQEARMEHGGAVFVVFSDELAIHGVALDVPDALLAPTGYRHGVDERFFEGGRGTELIPERGNEVEESLRFLTAEKDVGGENAVFDGVARGGEFALLTTSAALCFCVEGIRPDRFIASGFAAVGARGFDLEFGAHSFAIFLSHAVDGIQGGKNQKPLISRGIEIFFDGH
jgi:hypothetical protein